MSVLVDLVVALLLVMGGVFGLLGSWGLVRLPSTVTRLHTPTMTTTLGTGGILLASLVLFAARGEAAGRELFIAGLLLMTAPLSALFIAKSVIWRSLSDEDLPAVEGSRWATLDTEAASDTGSVREPPAAD